MARSFLIGRRTNNSGNVISHFSLGRQPSGYGPLERRDFLTSMAPYLEFSEGSPDQSGSCAPLVPSVRREIIFPSQRAFVCTVSSTWHGYNASIIREPRHSPDNRLHCQKLYRVHHGISHIEHITSSKSIVRKI